MNFLSNYLLPALTLTLALTAKAQTLNQFLEAKKKESKNPVDLMYTEFKDRSTKFEIDKLCEDTKEVKLDNPGYALSKMTDTIQAHGICYAHAAGQTYDAFRTLYPASKKPSEFKQSSLAHIAYIYKSATTHTLEAGDPYFTLMALNRTPPCPVESTLKIEGRDGLLEEKEKNFSEATVALCSFKDQFSNCTGLNTSPADFKAMKNVIETTNSLLKVDKDNLTQDSNTARLIVQKSNIVALAKHGNAFNCEQKNKSRPYDVYYYQVKESNRRATARALLKLLDRDKSQNLPLPIVFCSNRVYLDPYSKECGSHAVTVIGKRYNKQKKTCEFYIHDSGYPSDRDLKNTTNENPRSQKRWVSVDRLLKETQQITSILPKGEKP